MTNEDKKLICDYMGWKYWPSGKGQCYRVSENGGDVIIHFDLNDAGLVVQEMKKKHDWHDFINNSFYFTKSTLDDMFSVLLDADKFFKTFVEWRKGK